MASTRPDVAFSRSGSIVVDGRIERLTR